MPPAITIAILFKTLASLKEPSSVDFSSSPSILTNPPNGINLKAYLVTFPFLLNIVGPNPIANSLTFTLQIFATKKCPLSCINTKNPNKKIIFTAFIIIKPIPPLRKFNNIILVKNSSIKYYPNFY